MKKLIIAMLVLIYSCEDSEMVIPGENVGDIDGIPTEEPVKEVNLIAYKSNYPNAVFNIDIDEDGQIKNIDDNTINLTAGKISNIETENTTYTLTYNPQDILVSMTDENNNDIIEITNNGNAFTATRQSGSNMVSSYNFPLDSRGYIMGYQTSFSNGKTIQLDFALQNENISQISYKEDENEAVVVDYVYDSQPNPMQTIGIKDYNTLMIVEALDDGIGRVPSLLPLILLVNNNNMIESKVNDLGYNITYEYQEHIAQKGKVKNLNNEIKGKVEYIYQD